MNAEEERSAKRAKVDAADAGQQLTITYLVDSSTHITDAATVRLSDVIMNLIGDVDDETNEVCLRLLTHCSCQF